MAPLATESISQLPSPMSTTPITPAVSPKRLRRFVLLTVLVALGVAVAGMGVWKVQRYVVRRVRKQRTIAELEKAGARLKFESSCPDWIRKHVGDQVADAVFPERILDLDLEGTQVTDAGLAHLKGLTNLKSLDLYYTRVTDAGLVHLKGLKNLEWLRLEGTQVTDAGLVHLKGLTKLQTLSLYSTQVTPEGVKDLQQALPNCKIE